MIGKRVVVDACVFFKALTRELIAYLGQHAIVHVYTSNIIHEEWSTSLVDEGIMQQAQADRAVLEITTKLSYGLRTITNRDWNEIERFQLPDANDRHVLYLADQTASAFIVTYNLRHYRHEYIFNTNNRKVLSHRVKAIHPDDFFLNIHNEDSIVMVNALAAVTAMRNDLDAQKQIKGMKDICGLPRTSDALMPYIDDCQFLIDAHRERLQKTR